MKHGVGKFIEVWRCNRCCCEFERPYDRYTTTRVHNCEVMIPTSGEFRAYHAVGIAEVVRTYEIMGTL